MLPDRVQLPAVRLLTWHDVDPAGRPGFDPATVAAVVAELVTAASLPAPGADRRLRDLWLESVSAGLVARYGRWAAGWHWSTGEGDLDGGPVDNWCCTSHSITTVPGTADAVTAALIEWHDWLTDLAERFDRFLPLAAGDLDGWERAVAHLVTAVGDRTRYESGWYGCCLTVLGWFLEAAGIAPAARGDLLEDAVGGRFASWTEPDRNTIDAVAERVAGRAADV